MRLLMKKEQYEQFRAEIEHARIRVTSKAVRGLVARCYELTFPNLVGGATQIKIEKQIREKLTPYLW